MNRLKKILSSTKKSAESMLMRDTRKRVNLFIVGEQKCGTTSLFKLLCENELVLPAKYKECHYFDSDKMKDDVNFKNYHHLFRHPFNRKYKYLLEASPDYLGDELAYKNIYMYNPDSKIIIMLRNPVQRFISAYNFYFSNIIDNLDSAYELYFQYTPTGKAEYEYLKHNKDITIEDFLEDEITGKSPVGALRKGHYFRNVEKWVHTFGEKNVCELSFETLINPLTQGKEIEKLENFLSLNLVNKLSQFNASQKKFGVSKHTIEKLEIAYSSELLKMNLNANASKFDIS